MSLGDLRRGWTVLLDIAGGNGMSCGRAVHEPSPLVVDGPAPKASETSEKFPIM